MVVIAVHKKRNILSNVYGYNNQVINKEMFEKIGSLINELKLKYVTDNI